MLYRVPIEETITQRQIFFVEAETKKQAEAITKQVLSSSGSSREYVKGLVQAPAKKSTSIQVLEEGNLDDFLGKLQEQGLPIEIGDFGGASYYKCTVCDSRLYASCIEFDSIQDSTLSEAIAEMWKSHAESDYHIVGRDKNKARKLGYASVDRRYKEFLEELGLPTEELRLTYAKQARICTEKWAANILNVQSFTINSYQKKRLVGIFQHTSKKFRDREEFTSAEHLRTVLEVLKNQHVTKENSKYLEDNWDNLKLLDTWKGE